MFNFSKLYIPDELVRLTLSFHPLFFHYKRQYIKTTSISEIYHRDDIISLSAYNYLVHRYRFSDTTINLSRSILIHNIYLFFETANVESENDCQLLIKNHTE